MSRGRGVSRSLYLAHVMRWNVVLCGVLMRDSSCSVHLAALLGRHRRSAVRARQAHEHGDDALRSHLWENDTSYPGVDSCALRAVARPAVIQVSRD